MTTTLAILYERGPNWVVGGPSTDQPLREHTDYLRALHRNGKARVGRRGTDDADGLVILTADDLAEAERLIINDPAIVAGMLKANVKGWYRLA